MIFKQIKAWIAIFLISLLLTACGPNRTISKPIVKASRIAVIANFRNQGLFQRVGTTSVDNVSFYRRIPKLRMNALVTTSVANDLYRSRRYKVIPIYHATWNNLLDVKVQRKRYLSPQYKEFISRQIAKKNIDAIVLITPGKIDFGDGQYFGPIWWASGYGLFNRAFFFMQTNIVFAAVNIYIVDGKTYRVLGRSQGEMEVRSHEIKITWHKGYTGVPAASLNEINKVIRKRLPGVLKSTLRKTGFP